MCAPQERARVASFIVFIMIVVLALVTPSLASASPHAYAGTEQGYRHIATGDQFTLELRSDGTVWAAGRNDLSQLGDGTTTPRSTPVQVTTAPATPLADIIAVAAGMDHGLALRSDGTVWAWGQNDSGQLGDGSITIRSRAVQATYVGGAPLTDIVQLMGGDNQTYVLRADGTVWAFGLNDQGQLGDNSGVNQSRAVQSRYDSDNSVLTDIVQIAASGMNATVLRADGTVWSWGMGLAGRNGDNTGSQRNRAVQSQYLGGAPLTNIVSVARGDMTGLVVRSDGTAWAWGSNPRSQLADNSSIDRAGAVQMTKTGGAAITNVVQVAGGYLFSMVLCADGSVWMAGDNDQGQLGDGTSGTDRARLVQATKTGGTAIDRVAAITGGAYHSVMLRADGTTWTAGINTVGMLGTGVGLPGASQNRAVLSLFARSTGYVQVSKGAGHALGLRADGTVWAWGSNADGELGDGTTASRGRPVQVTTGVATPLTDVVHVVAGGSHSVAVRADGTVWSWGDNSAGQLGDGTTTDRSRAVQLTKAGPVNVTNATKVAAGALHTTVLIVDGTVLATGANADGQLGDGTTTAASRAVASTFVGGAAMTGIKQVDAGASNAQVAIAAGGTAWAWGDNSGGQLCDNSTTDRTRSVQVTTTAGATLTAIRDTAMSAGTSSAMLLANGSVFGCGTNTSGQLADGTTTSPRMRAVQATRSGPVNIAMARSLGGGDVHGLSSQADGSVLAWGANGAGQLGDGSGSQQTRAVQSTYASAVNLSRMTQVSAGDTSSLALRVDGTLWSWGSNASYQLGDCTNVDRARAVQVDLPCSMPNQPTALAQFRADGTTAISSGGWTTDGVGTNVVLKFSISDPDATQTITPWVEVRAGAVAFAATCGQSIAGVTFVGSNVAAPSAGVSYAATVNVTGLTTNTTYRWRACGVDQSANIGNWTTMGGAPDFGIDTSAPNATTPLGGSNADTNAAPQLSWASPGDVGPSGITTYLIYRNTTSAAGPWGASYASNATLAWTDPSPVAGTTYWYKVQAVDAAGNEQSTGNATRQVRYLGAISLTVGVDDADIQTPPALPGIDVTTETVVSVTTNNATGYALTVADASDTYAMRVSPGIEVPDFATGAPTAWLAGTAPASGWAGITVLGVTGATTTKSPSWGTGTAPGDYSLNKYAGISPSAPATLHSRAAYFGGADTITTSYRVGAGMSTTVGSYVANLTYTAVANP